MQLFDQDTQQAIGYLADINTGGFKLDCQSPISLNKDFRFRLDLTSEVADKSHMVFLARSKWCQIDPFDPFSYNVGFQLIYISPGDIEIFNCMIEKYGVTYEEVRVHLRRSNMW